MSSEPPTAANPYFRLFYGALRGHGAELVGTFVPSRRWLRKHCDQFDVIHFHWPEWLIRSEPDALRFVHKFAGGWRISRLLRPAFPSAQIYEYRKFLKEARAAGKRIVWTCHNVEPHESGTWPVRAAFRWLARAVDLVICHDQTAGERCRALYAPRGRVVIMEHGNYDGVYPPPRPRPAVLREVGLDPSLPLVLCVGQVRPYKGTDLVCEAVAKLSGRVSLLIAGHAPSASYARRIRELVERLPNAALIERHLSEQEFSDYVAASELVLLPYRSVTGSGAALAALTLGRGVITSDLPFFADLLHDHPDAGRISACGDVDAMAKAVVAFLDVPSSVREAAARELAARFAWPRLVPKVAAELQELVASS